MQTNKLAKIIESFGRMFIVMSDNKLYQATTKAKNTKYVVGDMVYIDILNDNQAQITDLQERKNLIYRSDKNRSKIIASNLNQLLIVTAVVPNVNLFFINSCLICAHEQNIQPIILINKSDLQESAEFIKKIKHLYNEILKYPIITIAANNMQNNDLEYNLLYSIILNHQSVLIGQSGVGKSTITNKIIANANATTNSISKSGNTGHHTTTHATLYTINATSTLIDCPGLQEFGLYHLEVSEILNYFPEFREYIGKCKFRNCRHINELGCAILNDITKFDKTRIEFLWQITKKLLQNKDNYK